MRLDYVARPAGTKPAAVYWRRRTVALGVLLLLVWFAAKSCGGSGDSASNAAGASASAHAHPSTQQSGVSHAAGKGAAPSAAAVGPPGASSAAHSTAPPAVAAAMCDGSTLTLRAAVNRLKFHRPFTAGITLQIATRSPSPCGLDASALRAQVLDGSRVLWSSDGCGVSGSGSGSVGASSASTSAGTDTAAPTLITVPSQSAAAQHYSWRGNVCAGQLTPGRYDVVGRLGLAQAFAGTVTVS